MQHGLVVHINVRVSVQPFEKQVHVIVRKRRGIGLERGPVFPIGEANPLQTRVVILVKRIGNQAVA